MDIWEEQFNSALMRYHKGDVDFSVEEFRRLAAVELDARRRASALFMVGSILLYDQDSPIAASAVFRDCIEAVPNFERASIGLFHSLVDQKLVAEALSEMKRFTRIRPSDEYTKILAERKATELGE